MTLATSPSERSPWDTGATLPWGRQPGEGSKAFAAFCLYRDFGPNDRSLRLVSRELRKDYGLIARWSRVWGWVGRCMAWDADNERAKRIEQTKALAEMARRQALAGQLMQAKGIRRLNAMSEDDVSRLSVFETVRLIEVGVRLERTARGQPALAPTMAGMTTETVQTDGSPTILELLDANPGHVGPMIEALSRLREVIVSVTPRSEVEDDTRDRLRVVG